MTYVPTTITNVNLNNNIYSNIFSLVEEYEVANSYITVQDREKNASYPLYTIFIPQINQQYTDNKRTTVSVPFSVNIDFDALPGSGDWQKTAEMHDALRVGFETETTSLTSVGLTYKGSEILSSEPIDVNGQQVFCRTVRFDFIVSL